MEYLEWDFGALGGHEVGCVHGAESYGVVVGTFVTHNTDAAHIGEGCEVLAEAFDAGFGDLVAVDVVGVLNDADFFCRYFADDTDSRPGPGNGWRLTRYSGMPSSRPALRTSSLKRRRRGSMISLKSTPVRETTDIVVGLDDCGFTETGFDHVRVNRSLY